MDIEKKVFEKMAWALAARYSIEAVDLILDHYKESIKADLCLGEEMPSDAEIKSEVRSIWVSCDEFSREAEALAACANDSALEKMDDDGQRTGDFEEPDRDYLEDHYDVVDAKGVFLLFADKIFINEDKK